VTSDGDEYVGEFREDLPHGHGHLRWRTGEEFIGEFVKGMRSGQGSQTMPAGRATLAGKWLHDLPTGSMSLQASDPIGLRSGEWVWAADDTSE
jgi:hypothetical protein